MLKPQARNALNLNFITCVTVASLSYSRSMKLLFCLHSHTLLNFSLREFLVERKSKGRAKGDSVHFANK